MDPNKRESAHSLLNNILVRKISVLRVNIKAGKVTEERQGTTHFWEVYSYRADHSERVDCIFNMKN